MLGPLVFEPIFKERVWGGRQFEALYGKKLPAGVPIGESWEICDRPEEVSVVREGPLRGRTLRWLMENHPRELLGAMPSQNGRFPLLMKILDARQALSVQVHPPAEKALELGGEPKTEMWYVADAEPGAELFAGLKKGVPRGLFAEQVRSGALAESLHRLPVSRGDALFVPSGRIHALGAGLVIFEIQQNSDTTYRVFDWNRVGLDGKPRALHVRESMTSIDFADFEPSLIDAPVQHQPPARVRTLVENPLFSVRHYSVEAPASMSLTGGVVQVIALLSGSARVTGAREEVALNPGDFVLLPACLGNATMLALKGPLEFLLVGPGVP